MTEKSGEKQRLGLKEAMPKIERYCAYQERCHKEVKDKLFSLGVSQEASMQAMDLLVKSGFLNEERFALAFAGGKFRQKQWGKKKIERELKLRNISEYCIRKALKSIEMPDYGKTLKAVAEKYVRLHKGERPLILKNKTMKHLLSKGYEYDQCQEILENMSW